MVVLTDRIAVLGFEDDLLLSRVIEQTGSLDDYDARIRDVFVPMIPVGGWVIDGGAFLGSHTVPYAERVGPSGHVTAFEPAPLQRECLIYNTRHLPQVEVIGAALCGKSCRLSMVRNTMNAGATVIGGEVEERAFDVVGMALDSCEWPRLDFLKLDIEGLTLQALEGAERTIRTHRPIVVAEVGDNLRLFGDTTEEVIEFMAGLGYRGEELKQINDGGVWDILFRPEGTL